MKWLIIVLSLWTSFLSVESKQILIGPTVIEGFYSSLVIDMIQVAATILMSFELLFNSICTFIS